LNGIEPRAKRAESLLEALPPSGHKHKLIAQSVHFEQFYSQVVLFTLFFASGAAHIREYPAVRGV
jgi:hypothetical protein